MINILLTILLLINYSIKSLYIIKYFQEDNYHYRVFKILLTKNIVIEIINLLLIPFVFLNKTLLIYITLLIIILTQLVLNLLYKRIKLKKTNRLKRLLIINLLVLLSVFIVKPILTGLIIYNILYILLTLLACIVSNLIEKLIRIKYYNKAKKRIKKYNPFIIGITGSCGKTSIKNYLYECLYNDYLVYKSPKSYNTKIGLTITINKLLNIYDSTFILEMGLSHKNDIKNITKLYKPNIAIITEILPSHLETMKSIDKIINEKMQIVKNMKQKGLIIINADNDLINRNIDKYNIHNNKIIKIGSSIESHYYYTNENIKIDGIDFKIIDSITKDEYNINSKLIGRHNIYNLLIVFSVLKEYNLEKNQIIKLLNNLENYENRLETKKYNKMTILNDSYNSNINGFLSALEILSLYKNKKIIITPGIVESGNQNKEIINKISNKMIEICDFCYIINNKNTKFFLENFQKNNYKNYKIKYSFIEAFNEVKNEEITLLIENDLTDFYYLKK